MTPQHFREILESICISTHTNKTHIAHYLSVTGVTLSTYQRNGVPTQRVPLIMSRLKEYMFSNLGG